MSSNPQESASNGVGDDGLSRLRSLLISPEQEALRELRQTVDHDRIDTNKLAEMLPSAILTKTGRDDQLGQALSATLATAFRDLIRKDPKGLVEVISPIMGPAIRRSILQTISGMVQSLNHTLEASLSWRGLRWRWESIRTGRPFAEIVLLHTLLYRIEQVFLIHRETGLLLHHVVNAGGTGIDADLISGMLTAIQDFVRDSFGGQEDDTLETMRCGDRTVWIEHGTRAVIAAVIQGEPPAQLHTQLCEALEEVQLDWSQPLASFDGDATPFQTTGPLLEACLVTEYRPGEEVVSRRQPLWRQMLLPSVAAMIVTAGLFFWFYESPAARYSRVLEAPATVSVKLVDGKLQLTGEARQNWIADLGPKLETATQPPELDLSQLKNLDQPWLDYVAILEREPGVVITDAKIHDDHYSIAGLLDPLAASPQDWMTAAGLTATNIVSRWRPFYSLDEPLVLRRAQTLLAPPSTVRLKLENNTLVATGVATAAWRAAAQASGQSLAGVDSVDVTGVTELDRDWIQFVAALRQQPGIEIQAAEFNDGHPTIVGRRDPLAVDPASVASQWHLDPEKIDFSWEPFASADQAFREQRMRDLLAVPEGVEVRAEGERIVLSGRAEHAWLAGLEQHRDLLRQLGSFESDGVVDIEREELIGIRAGIERTTLLFSAGSTSFTEPVREALRSMAARWTRLSQLAAGMDQEAKLIVVGVAGRDEVTTDTAEAVAAARRAGCLEILGQSSLPAAEMEGKSEIPAQSTRRQVGNTDRQLYLGVRFDVRLGTGR